MIGVNLLWLVTGVVGGSEEYTVRLLTALDADQRLRLYCRPDLVEAHPELAVRHEIVHPPWTPHSKLDRVVAEHTWLARVSRHDELVHHAGGVVPFVTSTPTVLTIHDLQPLEMPENFSAPKLAWLRSTLRPSVRRARLVLCPSEFTAGRVVDLLGGDPDRVVVVPHGHDAAADPDPAALAAAERFGRYVLLPAIAYPHKRHVDLIEAVARVREHQPDLGVVLTGRPGPELPAVLARANELGVPVEALGRVPEAELDALYHRAEALVFPSEYEGFGNPILEAMTRDCRVVATTATCVPEVAGDAAILVEPRDPGALAAAITTVTTDPGVRDRLIAAGRDRAARFGWSEAGAALAAAYRRVLA